jgi:hypothetical protein
MEQIQSYVRATRATVDVVPNHFPFFIRVSHPNLIRINNCSVNYLRRRVLWRLERTELFMFAAVTAFGIALLDLPRNLHFNF